GDRDVACARFRTVGDPARVPDRVDGARGPRLRGRSLPCRARHRRREHAHVRRGVQHDDVQRRHRDARPVCRGCLPGSRPRAGDRPLRWSRAGLARGAAPRGRRPAPRLTWPDACIALPGWLAHDARVATPESSAPGRPELAALRLERRAPAPPRRRRVWIGVAVGALVILAAIARRFGGGGAAVELVAPTVVRAGTPEAAGLPARSGGGYVVSGDRYIAIGVTVPGRIDRYLVEEGDHVKAGDTLVQLDAREYEATVRRAEAQLASARANLVLKRAQRGRAGALQQQGVVGREELDLREAEALVAEAAVSQAEADLAKARVDLEYTTLRAPRDGVILSKVKEVGEIAVPGGFSGSGDLIRMANLDDLRGQVDVT